MFFFVQDIAFLKEKLSLSILFEYLLLIRPHCLREIPFFWQLILL